MTKATTKAMTVSPTLPTFDEAALLDQAQAHARLLFDWYQALPELNLSDLEASDTAFACVDVIEGFTRTGALASPRVAAIISEIVALTRQLEQKGVPAAHMAFIQDAHPEDAQEFTAYPPHCIKGTLEAEAPAEFKALGNWQQYQHFEKNSIASHTSPEFLAWLEPLAAKNIIAVGDVTDLCLYTLALHLQVRNLARGLKQRIIVPETCAQTWDAPDHPGDLYHLLYLYQLARNGVEVVKSIRG